MVAIIVNNTQLDLAPDVRVPLNLKVSSVKDAGEIFTSFTNSFDIPYTDNNVRTFENSHNMASESTVPYRVLDCKLLFNGRDLFGRSRLVILESGDEGWKASFFAGDTTLAFSGTLRDILLSDLNFTFDPATCAAKADDQTNILYAPVNYGVDFISSQVDIKYSHFQFYCKSLVGRMFQALNIPLVIKGSTPVFDKLVLPMLSPKKVAAQWQGYSFTAQRAGSNQILPTGSPGPVTTVIFNSVVSGNEANGYNTGTGIFAIPYGSRIDVEAIINWNVTSGTSGGTDNRVWEILINGVTVKRVLLDVDTLGTKQTVLALTDYLVTVPITDLHIKYQPDHSGGSGDQVLIGSTLNVKISDEIVLNNTVDVALSMPDIGQGEFFSQIILMSNAIIYFQFGQVTAMPFGALHSSEVVDLSDKLDLMMDETVSYQSSLGRVTTFRYDNDNLAPTSDYGGAKVMFDNQALPPTVEFAKLIFSAAADLVFADTLLAMFVPVFSTTKTLGPGICSRAGLGVTINFSTPHKMIVGDYFNVEEIDRTCMVLTVVDADTVTVAGANLAPFTNSTWSKVAIQEQNINPRIGIRTDSLFTAPMTYRYHGTVANVPTYYGVYFNGINASVDGLSWEKLLKRNFLLWLGSMERYKMLRAYFNVNDNDVLQINFTRQYYIKKHGSLFFLQGVNKYVGDGNSTEFELVRLGQFLDVNKIKPL